MQLVDDPGADGLGQRGLIRREAERRGERRAHRARTRRARTSATAPIFAARVGLEQVRAAVDGVHRLTIAGLAWIRAGHREVGLAKAGKNRCEGTRAQRRNVGSNASCGWHGSPEGANGYEPRYVV